MSSSGILKLNAAFTTAGAVGMLSSRAVLPGLFGLAGPMLLDVVAAGLLAYAALLIVAARRHPVRRETLVVFTVADLAWVLGSGLVLVLFWEQMAVIARLLVLVVALIVEVFAALQFRASRRVERATHGSAA